MTPGPTRIRSVPAVLVAALPLLACSSPVAPVPLGWGEARVFSSHREIDVGFASDDGTVLAGTLLLPAEPGSYPAVVFHFGSNRWTRMTWDEGGPTWWVQNRFAVFTYDKRGVGQSGGECCPWREPDYFPLLGADVLAGVRQARAHAEVRADLVGIWGFSQGGWVVPVAAARGRAEVAFTIIGSGPAVTLDEELLYSALTGEPDCRPSGLSEEEIERRLDEAGPGGFDPRPWLEDMIAPGLWIYGGLDRSVPVARSVANLHDIRDRLAKDFTTVVVPDLNHSWVRNGGICDQEGPGGIEGALIVDWLRARFEL